MRSQISLLQVIGFCLLYAALGFLYPTFTISLNPFQAAPFWIVTLALSVLLIGLALSLLAGRSTPQFKPTRLQWLGIYMLCLMLFLGAYLLSTRGMQLSEALPVVVALVITSGMQLWPGRSQKVHM